MAMESKGETRNYKKSFLEVFSAITKSLKDLKIEVVNKNEKEGIINIFTGFTSFSTGGEGAIEVKSVPDTNKTAVTIDIMPKMMTALSNWGQSSRETKQIFNKIEEYLETVVTEPVPGKIEPSTSNTCPSCGKHVGTTDEFCQKCGTKLK